MPEGFIAAAPVTSESQVQEIAQGITALGLAQRLQANPTAAAKLARYSDELLKWNRHYNLVSRRDTHRLLSRHLLDSLSVLSFIEGPRVVDLGSGAGLPGIPLSLLSPELEITLLERSEKKCRFLKHCVRVLQLQRVRIENIDAKNYHPVQMFDSLVSRAVSSPQECLALADGLLQPEGRVVLFCGEAEPPPERVGGFRLIDNPSIDVPGLSRQHQLQVFKMVASQRT